MTAKAWTRLIHRLRDLRMAQSGAIAAEFALVIPVLLLFSFSIIEFGRAMWMRNAMQSVVEAAARCYALDRAELVTRPCDTAANTQSFAAMAANNAGVNSLTAANFTASIPVSSDPSIPSCGKQVTATYDFTPIVPIIPLNVTMSAKACRAAAPSP